MKITIEEIEKAVDKTVLRLGTNECSVAYKMPEEAKVLGVLQRLQVRLEKIVRGGIREVGCAFFKADII
jgi:hypothetical protein